tara:strand:- start:197 stop:673 length:477 start_codon:yes stop_codon:yes gene_type:complete
MVKREIFEIAGLIGVIGSLIFVGVEIRQNTSEIRGSTHQSVSEQINELYLTIAEDERLSKLVSEMIQNPNLRESLNLTDQLSLDFTVLTGLRRIENIYLQHLDGILSQDAFDRIGMRFYRTKYAKQTWEKYKGGFDSNFVLFFVKFRDESIFQIPIIN